ncbi:hypothetical protein NB620_10585 [Vibrio alginolyticus]|uniref:hypothetical protein n=1 Tax=Vibrio alginolyticus TaxID=663 RepID=UPI00215CA536|nr:hypothetical protein [Vibrio alginolyticus]MCS0000711.1 hypothetical protein [Vibrio alginolyticus]
MKYFRNLFNESKKQPYFKVRLSIALCLMPFSLAAAYGVIMFGSYVADNVTTMVIPTLLENPLLLIAFVATQFALLVYLFISLLWPKSNRNTRKG